MDNNFVLLTGTSNVDLAEKVASQLKVKVHQTVTQFADGEKRVTISENLRKAHVFIIQSTSPPVDSNLMELLLLIDASRRASAAEITAIIPYFGYSRGDRKIVPGEPISTALVTALIETAGVNRIVTIDIHSEQSLGFTKLPWDNLSASSALLPVIGKRYPKNLVVASPDKNGFSKATYFAEKLNALGVALVYKERDIAQKNQPKALDMIGDVRGKDVLLVDDMIDTAGTICEAASLIKKRGAKTIRAAAVHGLFSPPAMQRIESCEIEEVLVTDTVGQPIRHQKITTVSVDKLLALAIRFIERGDSLEKLIK